MKNRPFSVKTSGLVGSAFSMAAMKVRSSWKIAE